MSQFVETPCKTLEAGAAIAKNLRVVLSSGVLAAAGASDRMLGTMEIAALADGDKVPVRLRTAAGTRKMVASEAITAGNPVYAAASGKVAADGSIVEGIALEAAGADGDVIEVMTDHGGGAFSGILNATQQTLAAGGGAVNVTSYYTSVASDAGGDAITLANGTFPGQLKKIKLITDGGGDATLTPTSLTGATTITFADAGDYCVLLWDGDSWTAVELGNDADGATAPVMA
jgi:hypothetical protein